MIVGAGLPKIYKMLSDEKSYSERLFVYKQVDSLTYEQSKKAIEEPVRKFHVSYTENAIKKIVEITKGYPFFIQQLCQIVYKRTDSSVIEYSDVDQGIDEFLKMLDDGFFRSRYERCAESDKKFIFAMVKCGELPCTISNVAKNLHKSVSSISTTRAQLISKGIIYPVRYKELDFTVPEFSGLSSGWMSISSGMKINQYLVKIHFHTNEPWKILEYCNSVWIDLRQLENKDEDDEDCNSFYLENEVG